MDDEEYKEEEIDYFIPPDSWYIKIFDTLLFFSSMIYFICVPYFLSKNYFFENESKSWKIIFMIIDIIYILDLILNFFRAYQNYEERLIRKTKKIFFHYIKTWFILDFIQAIPFFSIIKYIEKDISSNNRFNLMLNGHHFINPKFYILLLTKVIKIYKMINDNSTISYFSQIVSQNELLDDHGGIISMIFITLISLNMVTCIFIFLGNNYYPGWIIKLNIQDKSYLYIYLTSVYFIIVTLTTVGYGDITGQTMTEIYFQIFLLIIGTIAYSFIVSYISNYIVKINQKSMLYEKNLAILQEIKIHHPNMKKSLYNEVLRNLHNEQLYERKDKHILFDCLPYSLKNKLIEEMYKPIIKNFIFFKDIDNSDFIVKVVTSLKPLIAIRGDIIIEEGDYINEIIFVKKGVIGLNININFDDPEYSLKKFFGKNEIGKIDISYIKSNIRSSQKSLVQTDLSSILNKTEDTINHYYNDDKNEDIKIIEIRRNEHFGVALMFLNERCPLVAKVKTKIAELLILRKMEAIEIYAIYPNIWKRINKKSLFNMDQIYLKIRKIVNELSNRYNINIDNYLKRKKSKKLKENVNDSFNNNEDINSNEENNNKKKSQEKEKEQKEIIIQEEPQKTIEFNENINKFNGDLGKNYNESFSNLMENITFYKNNTSLK